MSQYNTILLLDDSVQDVDIIMNSLRSNVKIVTTLDNVQENYNSLYRIGLMKII